MIQTKKLRISIVIPVYNEADSLGRCLRAIACQRDTPYEVIVVDNNSNDDTAAVARLYPFVRLLHAKRQGVVHARNCGFNAARGDIIGRIDADTLLPPDWTITVQAIFAEDPTIDAVSGAVTYHDLPDYAIFGKIDLRFRQKIADGMGDEVFLYGANMAIRRKTWLRARSEMCTATGMHEDFDLAIHSQEAGARIVFDRRLTAAVSLRRFDSKAYDFWEYVWLNPKTYAIHGRKSQRSMYPAMTLVVTFFWAIKLLYRVYDTDTHRFSLQKLFTSPVHIRVNPATFVD